MHPHAVDWFRSIQIHPDPKIVEQRWDTGYKFGAKLARGAVPALIRLFLFQKTMTEHIKWFTDGLLAIDKLFPVANNTEELRLMAGIVIAASLQSSSPTANAFALGLRSARFPKGRGEPAEASIVQHAEEYLKQQAEAQRPNDFEAEYKGSDNNLTAKYQGIIEAMPSGDAAKIQSAQLAYNKAIIQLIKESHRPLAEQVRRLAEESSLLWWVLNEYSELMGCKTTEVTKLAYALPVAWEAAQRTSILPPPHSFGGLLSRALKPCEQAQKKKLHLVDYLNEDSARRCGEQTKKFDIATTIDLHPIMTALAKMIEFDDAESTIKVLPNLCQGIDVNLPLSPAEAAQQFYNELLFVKSLMVLKN